jgi:L,D-transpeptidase ErfK/SrfK
MHLHAYLWRRFFRALLPTALLIAASSASAAEFPITPGQTVVGQLGHYVIKRGEVLADIARRFDVGYTELVAANPGVDPWIPRPGTEITIPSLYILPAVPHAGVVVNLGDYRLFYFPPGGGQVFTYPLGLGVIGWQTPLGTTRIVYKEPHPIWYPPESMRRVEPDLPKMVPAGPANPLGNYALHLGWPRVLIHGTDKPDGVGRNVSHGCIHLYPEDIEQLFSLVRVGTPVRTIEEPASAAWIGGQLYLAVHPSAKQVQQIDLEQPVSLEPEHGAAALVRIVAGPAAAIVDWSAVARVAQERTGMPIRVADRSAYVAQAPAPERPAAPRDLAGAIPSGAYVPAAAPPAAAEPTTAAPPQYPYADPARSPVQAQQSYDRAMQMYDQAERGGRTDSDQ